jgi:hypothetical protein
LLPSAIDASPPEWVVERLPQPAITTTVMRTAGSLGNGRMAEATLSPMSYRHKMREIG